MLARKQLGDVPGSPPDLFALFRDALNELRRRAGAALDDDSALLELARSILGGSRELPARALRMS